MESTPADCVACRANRGEITAPGGPLYDDGLWRLEHTFEPIPMVGWLVLKPLRHVEQLADLTPPEAAALGPLLQRVASAMRATLAPSKVYSALFAEAVTHLHIHLIPRAPDLPPAFRGPDAFKLLSEAAHSGRNLGDIAEAERVTRAIAAQLAAG